MTITESNVQETDTTKSRIDASQAVQENPPLDEQPYRDSYDEADIEALCSDPRFLVAVDAAGLGRCTLEQMLTLAFTKPPYIPRNLHPMAFARLVYYIIKEIQCGKISIDNRWKVEYSDFYNQQYPDPI